VKQTQRTWTGLPATGPERHSQETQDVASLRGGCETKPMEVAIAVCRMPIRAYRVAQPPSAGTTAEGGGAPCVTANSTETAKQSQLPCRTDGGRFGHTMRNKANPVAGTLTVRAISALQNRNCISRRDAGTQSPEVCYYPIRLSVSASLRAPIPLELQPRVKQSQQAGKRAHGGSAGLPALCETKPTRRRSLVLSTGQTRT